MNHFGIERYHCPLSLGREVKDKLVEELTVIARDAFGTELTREDVKNHVIPVSTLLIAKNEKETLGFSASNIYHLGDDVLIYGVGTCVLKTEQSKGIYSMLNEERLKTEMNKIKANDFYFSVRTQNPVIYGSIRKIRVLEKVYPEPELKIPKNILEIGSKMAHILNGEIDENFVMRNAYAGCMYDRIPRYKDESVNQMFDSLLNYKRGDALLIMAKMLK